jgi:hypothetical protein
MVAVACVIALSASAQSREDLENFKKQQQIGMQKTSEEFKQFADKRLEEYLNYEKQLKAEYEAFKKEIMDKWGDRTMVESSQKKWVEYGEDKDSRTTVDFEKGKVTVEVLADPTDDDKQIEKKLEKAVSGLINSKGKTVDFDSKVIPNKPLSNEPLLKDQIDFSKYSSLNLKKKNQVITIKKAFTVSKAQGKVTYKKAGGNAKIVINSAGKITVKKGLKKGTYKLKVKVTAAGNTTYKAGAKTVTVTIKVK